MRAAAHGASFTSSLLHHALDVHSETLSVAQEGTGLDGAVFLFTCHMLVSGLSWFLRRA